MPLKTDMLLRSGPKPGMSEKRILMCAVKYWSILLGEYAQCVKASAQLKTFSPTQVWGKVPLITQCNWFVAVNILASFILLRQVKLLWVSVVFFLEYNMKVCQQAGSHVLNSHVQLLFFNCNNHSFKNPHVFFRSRKFLSILANISRTFVDVSRTKIKKNTFPIFYPMHLTNWLRKDHSQCKKLLIQQKAFFPLNLFLMCSIINSFRFSKTLFGKLLFPCKKSATQKHFFRREVSKMECFFL